MNTIELLKEKELKIRNEIYAIRDKREKELLPICRKENIGKCFKHRNTYGSGKSWWLYTKILDVSSINFLNGEEPVFKTLGIQSCSMNNIEITVNEHAYIRSGEYVPISKSQFNNSVKRIMTHAIALFKD